LLPLPSIDAIDLMLEVHTQRWRHVPWRRRPQTGCR
jgi:hypothetical protein